MKLFVVKLKGEKMTKEEAIKILELTRDGYLKKANDASSFAQGTFAEMFEDKTIALNMAICALRASNRPSDARKGEGWSTISVDENVGSNRELARPSLTINLVLKDDSSVPIVKEALSNFDDRRIDELINYIKALIMLTKE